MMPPRMILGNEMCTGGLGGGLGHHAGSENWAITTIVSIFERGWKCRSPAIARSEARGRGRMGRMRLFGALVLAALAACAPPSLARAATALVFSLTTTQGPTTVDSATGLHPSEVGETFVSSLALANAGSPQLGRRAWAQVGTMRFSYTIRRQCAAFGPLCDATADFATVSALP